MVHCTGRLVRVGELVTLHYKIGTSLSKLGLTYKLNAYHFRSPPRSQLLTLSRSSVPRRERGDSPVVPSSSRGSGLSLAPHRGGLTRIGGRVVEWGLHNLGPLLTFGFIKMLINPKFESIHSGVPRVLNF